jgi:hypothetical protein
MTYFAAYSRKLLQDARFAPEKRAKLRSYFGLADRCAAQEAQGEATLRR